MGKVANQSDAPASGLPLTRDDILKVCGLDVTKEREQLARRALLAAVDALDARDPELCQAFRRRVAAELQPASLEHGCFEAHGPLAVPNAAALNARGLVAFRLAMGAHPFRYPTATPGSPGFDESWRGCRERLLAVLACRALTGTLGTKTGWLNGLCGANLDHLDAPPALEAVAARVRALNAGARAQTIEPAEIADEVRAALEMLDPGGASPRAAAPPPPPVLDASHHTFTLGDVDHDFIDAPARWADLMKLAKAPQTRDRWIWLQPKKRRDDLVDAFKRRNIDIDIVFERSKAKGWRFRTPPTLK